MQEKTPGLFVAATANRIDLLPAEMIRKGRFDEVFFVDLPTERERMEIFKIHLGRRGVDPGRYNIAQLMEFTVGFTGAEIEQCVISAITRARLEDREVTDNDLIGIAARTVPLVADHEGTDQPHPGVGVRAGRARHPAYPRRPLNAARGGQPVFLG